MYNIVEILQTKLDRKNIFVNEPMSKHTSFRIGGIADYFVKVFNIDELKFLLNLSEERNIPITVIGNGTNLLVKDNGIRGIVVKLELNDYKIERTDDSAIITVGAGVSIAKLANIAITEELTGIEFLVGIPGTIGGAIKMNAGAHSREMKDIVIQTKYMEKNGIIKEIYSNNHQFSYRHSIFSDLDAIVLETKIKLDYGIKSEIKKIVEEYNQYRKDKQPIEFPNAGSVFKKKDGISVAKLIDECGLKGYRIGDAVISEKHAGFIVNLGNAKAEDVLKLIDYVKEKIKDKFDKELELEIIVIGE